MIESQKSQLLAWEELSVATLYEIIKNRQKVFIEEQQCLYVDMDDLDKHAFHLCGYVNEKFAFYARCLMPNVPFEGFTSIGRVITTKEFRGLGLGKQLMNEAIHFLNSRFPQFEIKIGAQAYLEKFYADFGFYSLNDPYLEDGIPHVHMIRPTTIS